MERPGAAKNPSPSRSVFRRALGATFIVALSLCPPAFAQRVTSTLSPQTIGAGQAAEYSIIIEDGHQLQRLPDALSVPGLEFNGPNSRTTATLVGGVVRQQIEFVWQVYAARPGTFVIPAQQIVASGQTFTVPQKVLQVQEGAGPTPSLEPFLKLHVEKRELYVGEVVPITVSAFFHRRTQLRNYEHPKLPRDDFVVKRFPPAGPSASVEVDGERYQPIVFSSALSAIREGSHQLGPATLDCVVDFPSSDNDRRATPGFPSFFQRMITRQMHLESQPLTITVKPLPTEGQPPEFSGAVGKFTVSARLNQPSQVKVGDPIAVELTVAGQGNFDAVSAPVLSVSEGWKLYPAKLTQENRSGGLEPGLVSFSQVLIPQKMASELPPFQLSYFDVDDGKYATARSGPVPLQMSAADPTVDPATGEAPTRDFSIMDAAIPEEQLDDILTVRPERSTLRDLAPQPRDSTLFWALQAIPAALIVTFGAVGLQRRLRASALDRRRRTAGQPRSCAEIRRDMRRSGVSLREFYALVREYLESWRFHSGTAVAAERVNGDLAGILERQSLYCYSGVPEADTAVSPREQKSVLSTLSRLD
jgi:hypothetical protein